ncbi:MAG: response regulator transcription factor [Chloroflexi bacterium]|nr:response regulator transcription factor [Chloroflexota bacterium]
MDTIRILIVDDHPMVRRGLKSLLSSYPDLQIVGEAEDSTTALRAAVELEPEIILLDIQLPGLDGVEVAKQLRHAVPDSKIIALTAYDNEEYVLNALRAGAYAYLLKHTSDETVVEAVRSVHQGKRLLSPALMDQVLRQFQTLAQLQVQHEAGLSAQEINVLSLVAQGATNEEIAAETHWSERTVKREIEEIMSKLGARNRAQAVAEGIRRGLI